MEEIGNPNSGAFWSEGLKGGLTGASVGGPIGAIVGFGIGGYSGLKNGSGDDPRAQYQAMLQQLMNGVLPPHKMAVQNVPQLNMGSVSVENVPRLDMGPVGVENMGPPQLEMGQVTVEDMAKLDPQLAQQLMMEWMRRNNNGAQ